MNGTRMRTLRSSIRGGRARFVARLVQMFTDDDRRHAAKELPGWLKEIQRDDRNFRWSGADIKAALLVAGAGCIPGPAAAAQWLNRADLRLNRSFGFEGARRHAELVVSATAGRPDEWRAEVGRRLAGRLRVADQSGFDGNDAAWWTSALLLRAAGEGPPDDEAFAIGWVRWRNAAARLEDDALLDAMVPRLFEVEAIGQVITMFGEGEAWRIALTRLAREGRLPREALLDGCLRRFLRGGTLADLRWYAELHDALAPDVDEATERVRDYLRLLPAAPPRVAESALHHVRRVDEAGRLEEFAFAEAAEALLFRPEKKLVRTALTWLEGAARADGARIDATITALTVAFGHEAHALQERAVRIAVKHGPKATDRTRHAVREAAVALPTDLRDRIGEVFGQVEAPATAPSGLAPPPPPAAFPDPITSTAELAEALAVVESRRSDWIETERLLAGMVDLAYRDPEGTREVFRPVFDGDRGHWYLSDGFADGVAGRFAPLAAARSIVRPGLRPVGNGHRPSFRPVRMLLARRTREIAMMIGRIPALLSTPTATNGGLDAGELVSRLERLEADGHEPGPVDLTLALLRVSQDNDQEVITRAARLTSPAGRAVASWLIRGGLTDLAVESVVVPLGFRPGGEPGKAVVVAASPRSEGPSTWLPNADVAAELAPLCSVPLGVGAWRLDPRRHFGLTDYDQSIPWWGPVFPTHTELAAVHLLPQLAITLEHSNNQGPSLLALAESDGPAGVATGLALAYGLAVQSARDRTGAVDALLLMAARERLPAAEVGVAIGMLIEHRIIKLGRVVTALGEAAGAGARAEVWTVIEHALPPVLDANAARTVPGVADLLALGNHTAEATGARARIPNLEALATRKGTSRTVKEATRLHACLTRS